MSAVQILTLALGVAVLMIGFKIYKWFEKGGWYYHKHPVAKKMDEMKASGKLENIDVMSAIKKIDFNKPKKTHGDQFEALANEQTN